MKLCTPFWNKHQWIRTDKLVEQLFTGGYCAWQRCLICGKTKFDTADKYMPFNRERSELQSDKGK